MTILIFDIETIPDIEAGRRLYKLQGLSDKEVSNVMFHKRRQEIGADEALRPHLQRVAAISTVRLEADSIELNASSLDERSEEAMVADFYACIERQAPDLVCWNGASHAMPVLNYRALVHGIRAPRYWEMSRQNSDRLHHLELMDVLAGYQGGGSAPLAEIASLLGFPGELSLGQSRSWDRYLSGELPAIKARCQYDNLNTYLVYLRLQLIGGQIDQTDYDEALVRLRESLAQASKVGDAQLDAFLASWQ
ncbi:MAG: 3'-5' exonuclease [Gammaproteobacteria bacterium]|nr:3'-5' exonuclease [Gammaproteobacteria bacterium]